MQNLTLLPLYCGKILKNGIRQINYTQNLKRNAETYYEILNLPNNCTNKEIRSAFVQLSKKFHPDMIGAKIDPKHTAKFVRINEAYHTLSKPKLRNAYDQALWAKGIARQKINASGSSGGGGTSATVYHKPWEIKPDFDPQPGAYYGVKGLNKMTNTKIVFAVIALGIFSSVLGFVSVKHSFHLNQQQLDDKSAEAGSHHAAVRAEAQKFGNETQLRRMVDRMMKEDHR